MKIAGLQKVSTIDYPGEICSVIFLWGCNFRCGFCYNPELVTGDFNGEGFSRDYILDFLSRRVGKLDAVCISGGEPLISLDLDFVRRIKSMGFKVKLDTNGSFPDKLREMVDEELVDYIAMDVKGCREEYVDVVGVGVDLNKVEESMRIVNEFGGEFRTTLVPGLHDLDKMRKQGYWMSDVCGRRPGKIFLQRFRAISEGVVNNSFLKKGDFLESELLKIRDGVLDLFEKVEIRS